MMGNGLRQIVWNASVPQHRIVQRQDLRKLRLHERGVVTMKLRYVESGEYRR